MSNPSGAKEFWRCGRCGTPNPAATYITQCVACGTSRALAKTIKSESPRPDTTAAPQPGPSRPARRRPIVPLGPGGKILLGLSVAYLCVVIALIVATRTVGDRFWPVALVLLGPRWVWFFPWIVLGLLSLRQGRRLLWAIQGLGAALVLGPLMGLNLPLSSLIQGGSPPDAPAIRILSLNRGGVKIDTQRLIRYLDLHKIDVICFQELGTVRNPELEGYFSNGWHVDRGGFVASRFPITEEIPPPPEENTDQERYTMTLHRVVVRRPDGLRFQVGSVHMPTLTRGFAGAKESGFRPERFSLHMNWWSKEFGRLVEAMGSRRDEPLVVAGDLNMPPDHPQVAEIRRLGLFRSAFEERGWGYGYTKPVRFSWIRIDHVLASPEWSVTQCWIGPDFGSDHKSIVAELTLPPGSAGP